MRRGEARRGGTRRGEEQKQEQEQKQDRRGAARTRTDCARIQVSVLRHAGTVKGQRGISRSLRYFVHLSPSQRAPLCSLIGPFPWPNYRRIVHHRCCLDRSRPLTSRFLSPNLWNSLRRALATHRVVSLSPPFLLFPFNRYHSTRHASSFVSSFAYALPLLAFSTYDSTFNHRSTNFSPIVDETERKQANPSSKL